MEREREKKRVRGGEGWGGGGEWEKEIKGDKKRTNERVASECEQVIWKATAKKGSEESEAREEYERKKLGN